MRKNNLSRFFLKRKKMSSTTLMPTMTTLKSGWLKITKILSVLANLVSQTVDQMSLCLTDSDQTMVISTNTMKRMGRILYASLLTQGSLTTMFSSWWWARSTSKMTRSWPCSSHPRTRCSKTRCSSCLEGPCPTGRWIGNSVSFTNSRANLKTL